MRLEVVQQLGKAAHHEAVAAADPRAFLEMDGLGKAVLAEHVVRDLERLREADGPAQTMRTDLEENLVGDVVVRAKEQLGQDLRKGARLVVDVDWLQTLGHSYSRDLALEASAGSLDACADRLPAMLQAHRGVLG